MLKMLRKNIVMGVVLYAGIDAGGIEGIPRSDTGVTKAVPTFRSTWGSAAPRLDPFGNETVPVFDSAYSGREPVM